MKKMCTLGIFAVVLNILLALTQVPSSGGGTILLTAQAQSTDYPDQRAVRLPFRSKTCSLASLKGTYGVLLNGHVLGWPGFPVGPIAAIAIMDFDGMGNYKSYANTAVLNGFSFNQPDFTGTYVVNSDCTGEVFSPLGIFPIAINDDGREYQVFWPGNNASISGMVTKIAPEPRDDSILERARKFYCYPGMMAGSYAIRWQGWVINPSPQPPRPLTGVTLFAHQANGSVTGKGMMDFNGIDQPFTSEMTTTVNWNCTFSAVSTTGDRYVGVFVNGGNDYYVLAVPPAGPLMGKVMYGMAKRTHPLER